MVWRAFPYSNKWKHHGRDRSCGPARFSSSTKAAAFVHRARSAPPPCGWTAAVIKWGIISKGDIIMKKFGWLFVLLCALVLPACGDRQLSTEPEGSVLVYAALNPVTKELTSSIDHFNQKHTDVQIEIHDYSDEGGLKRLQTELILGKVPDIMEMHYWGKAGAKVAAAGNYRVLPGLYREAADEYWMPYRQMAQKGYLEDLWPYIENDPEFGRDGVLPAPVKAAEVDGSLYILFQKVTIFTLTGRESLVGDRYSWTMDDVMEVLAGMPEGSTILRYNMTRRDVFYNFLRFSLDRFVDWETGTCHFDSQGFLDLVRFLEAFPDEVDPETSAVAEEEIKRRIKNGEQMLEGMMIDWQMDVGVSDGIWQERAAFPGYPTADGSSGSFFYPLGTILSMSATCQNKAAAWEYIRKMLRPRVSQSCPVTTFMNIPVNMHDFELLIWGEVWQQKSVLTDIPDDPKVLRKSEHPLLGNRHFRYGPQVNMLHLLSEEDTDRYKKLIDHTSQLYWPNSELSNIVWETLGPYFARDRALEDTIALLRNRVDLYLHERQ